MSIGAILGLFGGAQVVLLGLISWLGKVWIERTLATERLIREKDFEKFRMDLAQQQATLATSLAAATNASSVAYKQRLDSVLQMWQAARCHRDAAGAAIVYWDTLDPTGKGNALSDTGKASYRKMLMPGDLAKRCKAEDDKTEGLRPYLGEELWSLFYGYRMLLGRSSYPLALAIQNDERPRLPFDDSDVKELLEQLFGVEENAAFNALTKDRLQFALSRFEARMMAAADRLISGRQAAEESFFQAQRLLDAALRVAAADTKRKLQAP